MYISSKFQAFAYMNRTIWIGVSDITGITHLFKGNGAKENLLYCSFVGVFLFTRQNL